MQKLTDRCGGIIRSLGKDGVNHRCYSPSSLVFFYFSSPDADPHSLRLGAGKLLGGLGDSHGSCLHLGSIFPKREFIIRISVRDVWHAGGDSVIA